MNQITQQKAEGGLSYKNIGIAQAGSGGMLLPQTFGEVVAFATMMARSQHAIPKHLRENEGACMAVTMQALRWEMDPFMVASKSYNVKDLIAYEAQLVSAVVNTRAPIKGRLKYAFEGEGGAMTCTVTGTLDGEECVYTSPTIGSITTKNSPLWKSDPQQQLGYFSARSWARRHCPEVILGVYDRDEVEEFRGPDNARDVTPKSPVMERLRAATQSPVGEREGFNASSVHRQTESVLTGEVMPDEPHDPDTGELSPHNEASDPAPSPAAPDDDGLSAPSPADTPSNEPAGDISAPAGSDLFGEFDFGPGELVHLKDFARKALDEADGESDAPAKVTFVERMSLDYLDAVRSKEAKDALRAMGVPVHAVIDRDRTRRQAQDYIARDILGCKPEDLEGRK